MSHLSRRTAGLAGLVTAPLWIGVTALVSSLEWDFLHSIGWSATSSNEVPYPSATLRGDVGLLQSLNFVVTGVLVAVFALGFRREFRHRVSGWVATVAFALFSVGVVMNASPTDLPGEPTTWPGHVHDFGFLGVLLGVLVAYPASGLALRNNDSWRGWRLLGWWPALLVAIAFTNLGLPGDLGFMVFVGLVWAWVSLMGGHLASVARTDGAPRSTTTLPDAAAPGLL
ncbi:DUF998 domain-containing protein [Nocardioides guangzhouensis]|nr:DUF998 domain-containing protein [Nocardioides guangzhouensis]